MLAARSLILAISVGNIGGKDAAAKPTGMYPWCFPEDIANISDGL
jgi:hypothetical protein